MGVTGLWKLIESSGKPVPLETLENKVLAIDISIWLHQVVKGYQDNKGGTLPNAHLLGLFNRICKLLYFRIKPIFVFDGGVPQLKLQTIAKRAQSKSKIQNEAERLEQLLLETLAKEKVVKQALGDSEKFLISPSKGPKPKPTRTEERDEMFVLPPLVDVNVKKEFKSEYDEEDDELCPKRAYDVNINRIDVNSAHFKSLPADIRHDILSDIKETRKQNTWAGLKELPVQSNDFSSYQMSRLLRRRQVQVGLDEAEKEMGGKTWSLSELESLLKEDGVLEVSDKCAQKIASDENTRFLLVRDIAKAMEIAKVEHVLTSEPKPSTSTAEASIFTLNKDDDEDFELQRAIQMSLGNPVEEEEAIGDSRVKMNPEQRQKFAGTVHKHGLVRGFMMEYAEMNGDDIEDLIEATQIESGVGLNDSFREQFPNTDEYVLYGTPKKSQEVGEMSGSESENEVEEVKNKSFVIEIAPEDFKPEDDFFADVFETSMKKSHDIPDVEVASISSDDDTLPYEIPKSDFEDVVKETESGFVSEDGKIHEMSTDLTDEIPAESENDKFWAVLNDPVKVVKRISEGFEEKEVDVLENEKEKSENEKEKEKSENEDGKLENKKFGEQKFEKLEDENEISENEVGKSENEKFWGDEVVTIPDDDELESNPLEDQLKTEQPIEIPKDLIKISSIIIDPKNKTPTKTREISPPPAKVASPFFVNRKTPSSKKKLLETAQINHISVAKNLFPSNLEKAAQELRTVKTNEELEEMKGQLADQQKNLAQERNKLDRMGTSITESMSRDCKDLLKLFGIPYIDSPMEAEAQCAFLNMIELTDGTISDDSDIWLFGGQTVYKNFFVQKKIVMEFRYESIEKMFHLDRKKLIQLAMLVGSDYTVGINGVGAVTALEILAAFPATAENEGATDQYQSLVSSLRKFREWFQSGKQTGVSGKTVLKSKLKNVELFEGFPNLNIAKAYLEPTVDPNAEKFSWGMPDSESLIEYAKAKLGWTRMKTEEILEPVMKRLNEKKQATIKDYFKSQATKKFFETGKLSKRVQKAVGKMGGEESEEEEEKPKKTRKRKAKKEENPPVESGEEFVVVLSDEDDGDELVEKKALSELDDEVPEKKATKVKAIKVKTAKAPKKEKLNSEDDSNLFKNQKPKLQRKRKAKDPEPSTSAAADEEDATTRKRVTRIPETKQIIPQREKDKEESKKAKQKAIEIFNKSKKK